MNTLHVSESIVVCQELTEEHRSIEPILDQLQTCLKTVQSHPEGENTVLFADIQALIAVISSHLSIHFACEERGLFPVLSKYHPMVLMEVEHEALLTLWDAFCDVFNQASTATSQARQEACQKGFQFITDLQDHIAREDTGIFPMAERDLSAAEKQTALNSMHALRTENQSSPIPAIIRPEKTFQKVNLSITEPFTQPIASQPLFQSGLLSAKQIRLQKGKVLTPHWSPNTLFLLCISGKANLTILDESPETLTAGNGYVLDPRVLHALEAVEDSVFLVVTQAE